MPCWWGIPQVDNHCSKQLLTTIARKITTATSETAAANKHIAAFRVVLLCFFATYPNHQAQTAAQSVAKRKQQPSAHLENVAISRRGNRTDDGLRPTHGQAALQVKSLWDLDGVDGKVLEDLVQHLDAGGVGPLGKTDKELLACRARGFGFTNGVCCDFVGKLRRSRAELQA